MHLGKEFPECISNILISVLIGVSGSVHTDSSSGLSMFEGKLLLVIFDSREERSMGKNNTIIRQWLSDEGRMASLVNGCLFSGKQIFKKEHLKSEDSVQGVILKTEDGKETAIERYRDIMMTSDDGTRIIILDEIEDLSQFEESLQMVFGMAQYRKDVKSEEDGEMNMCKALEDLRQEGIDIGMERGMERGIDLGVFHFIEAFQEIGKSYEETMKKLKEKFSLTEEDAGKKMEQY